MSVVRFPRSGLTERECTRILEEGFRRLDRGLPGHFTRHRTRDGKVWVALSAEPGGPVLFRLVKWEGRYSVYYCGCVGFSLRVAEGRSLRRVLEALRAWPISGRAEAE